MYRYDDTITCEWNPRADELEQRIDDAAAFLQKVINAVYSLGLQARSPRDM